MAVLYRYSFAVANWAAMTTTAKFSDISPVDPDGRTTYESGDSGPNYSRLFGAMYFGSVETVAQIKAELYASVPGAAPLPQRSYTIYTSNDGVTWASAVTGSLTDGWSSFVYNGSLTAAYIGIYVYSTNAAQIPTSTRMGTLIVTDPPLSFPPADGWTLKDGCNGTSFGFSAIPVTAWTQKENC